MKRLLSTVSFVLLTTQMLSCGSKTQEKEKKSRNSNNYIDSQSLSYGLEIEPDFKNHPLLSSYYYPADRKLGEWKKLSRKARNELGLKLCSRGVQAVSHFKVIETPLDGQEAFPELPREMPCDSPGATEINDMVFQKRDDLYKFIEKFERIFGPAGSQTHVVWNRPEGPVQIKGMKGYMIYEADRAIIERLSFEYSKYLKTRNSGKKVVPGTNLVSSALFPISGYKVDRIDQFISDLKSDKLLDKRAVGKYLGLNLRTMSYPKGKLGFEIRSYDNTAEAGELGLKYVDGPKKLIAATERTTQIIMKSGDFESFQDFNTVSVPKYPNEESFKNGLSVLASQLSENIQDRIGVTDCQAVKLRELAVQAIEKIERIASFKYYNLGRIKDKGRKNSDKGRPYYFHYPFRDWRSYPLVAQIKDEKTRDQVIFGMCKATLELIIDMGDALASEGIPDYDETSEEFQTEVYTTATEKARIAVSHWANKIDLTKYFLEYEKDLGLTVK